MPNTKYPILTAISIAAYALFIISGAMVMLNTDVPYFNYAFKTLGTIGQLTGLAIILSTLQYKKLVRNKLIISGLALGSTAILFKLVHWQGSIVLLLLSAVFLIAAAIQRLIRKQSKTLIHYLKVIWFTLFIAGAVLKLNHYPGAYETLLTASLVLWLVIINYCYHFNKK